MLIKTWFKVQQFPYVSAAQGLFVATKRRERLASEMTSEQIAQAQKMAMKWQ